MGAGSASAASTTGPETASAADLLLAPSALATAAEPTTAKGAEGASPSTSVGSGFQTVSKTASRTDGTGAALAVERRAVAPVGRPTRVAPAEGLGKHAAAHCCSETWLAGPKYRYKDYGIRR